MKEKAILLSIQPKWCGLIANGKKTIEVRKTRQRLKHRQVLHIPIEEQRPVDGCNERWR